MGAPAAIKENFTHFGMENTTKILVLRSYSTFSLVGICYIVPATPCNSIVHSVGWLLLLLLIQLLTCFYKEKHVYNMSNPAMRSLRFSIATLYCGYEKLNR